MGDLAGDKRERISFLVRQIADKADISNEALEDAYEELAVLAEDLYEADRQLQKSYDELLVTKQQMEEERKHYRELFEFAPGAYLVTDMVGTIEKANRAAQKMLNVRGDFLAGKPLNLFVEKSSWKYLFSQLKNNSTKQEFELPLVPRGKDPIIVTVTLETVFNSLYEPIERHWQLSDITQLRHDQAEITELYQRLQASSEAERLRLAQDLHDGPMQDLYGAVFALELNNGLLDNPDIRKSIRDVEDALKHVASELRSICGELRPPTLANLGLERAIRSHAERIQERHPEIKFKLNLDKDGPAISQDMRLSLFRIYQQSMMNVLHHAEASRVEVRLVFDDTSVLISIRDDGKGFKNTGKWLDFVREGHYGLAGIAERTQVMSGVMIVDSAPGQGTHLQVKVPVGSIAA